MTEIELYAVPDDFTWARALSRPRLWMLKVRENEWVFVPGSHF